MPYWCNLFKERSGLRSRRADNGRIHLIRPDGSVMLPVGARPPTWADPDPPEPPATAADTCCTYFETISWSEFLARGRTDEDSDSFPIVRIDFAEVCSILDSS